MSLMLLMMMMTAMSVINSRVLTPIGDNREVEMFFGILADEIIVERAY